MCVCCVCVCWWLQRELGAAGRAAGLPRHYLEHAAGAGPQRRRQPRWLARQLSAAPRTQPRHTQPQPAQCSVAVVGSRRREGCRGQVVWRRRVERTRGNEEGGGRWGEREVDGEEGADPGRGRGGGGGGDVKGPDGDAPILQRGASPLRSFRISLCVLIPSLSYLLWRFSRLASASVVSVLRGEAWLLPWARRVWRCSWQSRRQQPQHPRRKARSRPRARSPASSSTSERSRRTSNTSPPTS